MNGSLPILYIIIGILFAILAVPLILGRVPPNGFYGVRTPQTLNNPDVWYKVNAYFGRLWLVVGVVLALVAIILTFIPEVNATASVTVCTLIFIGGILVAILLSFRYMQSLSKQ